MPALFTPSYVDGRLVSTVPVCEDVPAEVTKRTVGDLADWPYPARPLVPLTEVVHDRLNVEVFRGLHPGLPLLPGRHDHPPGARASGGPGPRDGAPWPRMERARRGDADVVVLGGLLGHRGHRARHRRGPRARRAGLGEPAVAARGRLHRRHGGGDPEGTPHGPHLRARGRHVADAHGDQQADHRGGPLRRRRRRLQPGLAAGQAVLPHRPAHRARRGRPRHRRARGALRRDRPAPPEVGHGGGLGGRLRAQGAHPFPMVRAGHRGRARAQGGAAARRGRGVPVA